MDLETALAALQAEAETLKSKFATDTATDEDTQRALDLVKEIDETRALIKRRDAASKALGSIAATPVHDSSTDAPSAPARSTATTIGEKFIESDAYRTFKTAHPKAVTKDTPISIKAEGLGRLKAVRKVLGTGGTGNAAPERNGEIDDLVYRPQRRLLEVITRGSTSSPWFQYRQVVSKTNNAAIVPEATTNDGVGIAGGLKPLSTLTTQTADAKAATYADGMEVTNQELADDGVIQTLIDSTLSENLDITIENILLNGDSGTNPEQPDGILNTSGVLQQAFAVDVPTTIRKAITLLRTTSGASIKGVLLNPEDDEAWDLLKDLNERYLGNGPFGIGPSTAWGYERISSENIAVGQAIIGDFSTIHLLDYEPLSILAFNQHKDYAQRNLTYIRAELRATQLIRNAAKLCVVDLTAGV